MLFPPLNPPPPFLLCGVTVAVYLIEHGVKGIKKLAEILSVYVRRLQLRAVSLHVFRGRRFLILLSL